MLIVSAALMALSFLLLGVTRQYGAMIAVCVALGVGFGWTDTFCNSTMVDLKHRRARHAFGHSARGFGDGSLLPRSDYGAARADYWQQISLVMGALIVLCGLVFLLLRAMFFRKYSSTAEEFRLSGAAVRGYLFRTRSVWILLPGFSTPPRRPGLPPARALHDAALQCEALGSTALSIY